jgi:transcriptional regulator with XRE-family HTH domain
MRALREARGHTCEQVAKAMGWSTAKISRMETGVRGLYPDDVAVVLGYLQAPADQRDELLTLVRDSAKPNWIQVGGKLPTAWKGLIRFENQAIAIYEALVIPASSRPATTPAPSSWPSAANCPNRRSTTSSASGWAARRSCAGFRARP